MRLNKIIFSYKEKLNDSNYNLVSFNKSLKIKNKKILFYDHPWENFKVYESDYYKLLSEKKKLLSILSNSLNKIHNKSFSEKYWNILLGTFIVSFLTSYLDAKTSFKFLKKKFNKNKLYYDELIFKDNFIPNTTSEFDENLYNGKFYEFIFQSFLNKRFCKTKFKNKIYYKTNKSSVIERIKILIFPIIFKAFRSLFYSKIIFIKSYFSYKEQSKILSHFTKKINIYLMNYSFFFKKRINSSLRKKLYIELNKNSEKKTNINYLISKLLPSVFLENYDNYFSLEKKLFPFAPKVIVNGIGDLSKKDDVTKFFLARSIENKSIILTRQHGGVYGSSKFSIYEKLQKENSNFFLTFGWKSDLKDIPISFPNLKDKILPLSNNKILLVNVCFPKIFHNYFPSPQSNKYITYLNNISLILNNSKKKVEIREYPMNFSWYLPDFIENYNNFYKDNSTSLINSLKKYNLAIVTYDSTTHLETFSLNFPTIIFFSKEYYSFRSKYSKTLNVLKSANVFFDNVNDMLNFINNDKFNINEWWFSTKVQSAIKLFNNSYSNKKYNYDVDWANFINKIKS